MIDLPEPLLALLAALLGLALGVLINALADDLPQYRSPQTPRYPNGAARSLPAWSGTLAFLLGQRQGPEIWLPPEEEKNLSLAEIAHLAYDNVLSWRHPLVELGLAALFMGIVLLAPDHPRTGVWFVFLAILLLITIIDLEHRLILYVVMLPSLALVLLINYFFPDTTPAGDPRPFREFLIGALLGGGVFFLMFLGGGAFADAVAMLRGRGLSEVPFGFGDVMLAILCGAMIGWRAMIFAMFITVFLGALGAILYMAWQLIRQGRYSFYTALPYGPYIVLGTVLMMLGVDLFRNWMGTN